MLEEKNFFVKEIILTPFCPWWPIFTIGYTGPLRGIL
jgi:hypothetical protein